ncbi:MAG: peptide chain release factor N(5)-glutamine methyltransferase [FCB group bacterium]|nr:peptide chain release factor N(5)-glutamine methyltransferase [FCB group bacterium]
MVQPSHNPWRIIDLINWGEDYFKSRSIENARRELEWLLCSVLDCKRLDLYLQFEQPLSPIELEKIRGYVQRRVKGEPFQHILGVAPFYGRDFKVSPQVLIPRPETEIILEIMKKNGPVESILEIGTGSGCIAITLALEELCKTLIATDIQRDALTVAKDNAAAYNVDSVAFRRHDFLIDTISSTFDVVISNPPYIAKNEIENLQKEVRDFEPKAALTDNADGLTFYRRFAELGFKLLNPQGFMLLEFGGSQQEKAVAGLFTDAGYAIVIHNDLQGDPRVIQVYLNSGL